MNEERPNEINRQRELSDFNWLYKIEADIPFQDKVIEVLKAKRLVSP